MLVPEIFANQIHHGYIHSLSIESQDEQLMLCGGADSSVTIFDLEIIGDASNANGTQPLARLDARSGHKFGISKVQWWPFDDTMFLTGSYDNTIKVWDSEMLEDVYSFDLEQKVYNFDINPVKNDGLVAAGLNHPHIRLLDLRTSATAHTLRGHESGSVGCVKWSPIREYMLASGGSDGLVRVWDIRQAQQQVAAMDLNRTRANQPLTPLQFRKSHRGVVNGLLWHPEGNEILSIGLDNKARVWDLQTTGGGINKSVNFGPLFQNRRQQTLEPCFYRSTTENIAEPTEELVVLPSDTGDVLLSHYEDGLVRSRMVPLGRESRFLRQGCVASRTNEFFSGTADGSILRWRSVSAD